MRIEPKWRVVAMLWMVCWLNYADRQAIFALFPLLRNEFGVDNVRLALLGTSFMWVYAIAGPLAGWAGDRFSRRGLIISGLSLWLMVTVATVLSHNFWQMVVLRAFSGLAEAVYFPAAMSLIASWHGPETRSRAMALHQSAVYGGTIGGGVLAAFVAEHYGWRSSFFLFGMAGLLILPILLFFLRAPQSEGRTQSVATIPAERVLQLTLKETLLTPLAYRLVLAFIGANFVAMIFLVWLPSFLFNKFHMSLSMAGISATLYLQAAAVVGVLCGGALADSWVTRNRGGRMKTQAVGLLLGTPFLFLAGWSASIAWLIAAMIGLGFFKGMYESNIWASLYDVVSPECRATAVGLMNSFGWLGGGMAPLAIAAASQHFSMSQCLSATSCIYVLAGCLLLWNARQAARVVAQLS
ncbi:MFS transporter [Telmatobacter bradus]|uniref:MFS transporter n=1 Tax=Telmatobacter bradus TaxID=474953 RepID=UPI003B42A9EE